MTDPAPTRRGFLLASGTAALAGCSELDARSSDAGEEIRLTQLPDVPDPDESEPILVDDIPVEIEDETLTESATRVTDLLGTLPMPLGPEDVPNGHVRRELTEAAEQATGHLDSARSAQTRLSALESLRRARSEARYAAAGWAFVDDDRTATELQAKHQSTVAEAGAFRSEYEYLGTDPVRAVVVHGQLRNTLERVSSGRPPSSYGDRGELLTVAEWGDHAESARAHLEDSRYLYDRFRATLPSDAGSLEATFETAAESLIESLGQRRDELPSEPEEADELADRLRYRLYDDAESGVRNVDDAGGPARAVLAATDALVGFLAYDRLQSRIDDGDRFRVETGEDVRAMRSAALEAIRTGLEESSRPALVRSVLADAAWRVLHADDELARHHSNVRPRGLHDSIRRYVTATVRAKSVPTACEQVVDALE